MTNYCLTTGDAARVRRQGAPPGATRRRILFVAEAITLAQVVRLVSLARSLPREDYDVFFACGDFDSVAFDGTDLLPIPLFTVDRAQALRKVERGERLYETDVLTRYVEEELRLFDAVKPDLVVGDFRLSLPISARRAGIPHAALINAYFSPYAVRDGFPVPDHPIVSLIGAARAARYFPRAMPAVFAHFVAPIDTVRKRHGLEPSGGLLAALSAGDFTLYPDVPELCPTRDAPANHRYLGHVPWAPAPRRSELHEKLSREAPLVYVTLGSSGRLSALKTVLEVIAELPVAALLTTAGRFTLDHPPSNVFVTDFAPGDLVAHAARFVVTNGGASTSYQALAAGRPVLGIPSNLDQYLAMTAIERAGAGRLVRAGEATASAVRRAFTELLDSAALRHGALAVRAQFDRYDYRERFRALVEEATQPSAFVDALPLTQEVRP
ncbi:MAG TPA: nucleotide disphospho-sugar-binding domain-containing protein [Polyangiaceae bacterium]|jgi:UDP:flavonoid glycosyltransferase YjiC (YdhE family)|nr:nucleotide disphospho-sugar-binding domain-containing protein [Polyangiaceae bacterium]